MKLADLFPILHASWFILYDETSLDWINGGRAMEDTDLQIHFFMDWEVTSISSTGYSDQLYINIRKPVTRCN